MLFTSLTTRKYLEDYTDNDWINSGNAITIPLYNDDASEFANHDVSLSYNSSYSGALGRDVYTLNDLGEGYGGSVPDPVAFVNAAIRKNNPTKISIFVAVPASDSAGYVIYYSRGQQSAQQIRSSDRAFPVTSDIVNPKAWVKRIKGTASQLSSGATLYKTISFSLSGYACKYNVYEVTTYDRYAAPPSFEIGCQRRSFADSSSWRGTRTNQRWGWEGGLTVNKEICDIYTTSYLYEAYYDNRVKTAWIKDFGSASSVDTTEVTLPRLTEYYIDTRSTNFHLSASQNSSTAVDTTKLHNITETNNFYFTTKVSRMRPGSTTKVTKYTITDGDGTKTGRISSSSSSSGKIEPGTNQSASGFYATPYRSDEQYILPANALTGYLSIAWDVQISDTSWWYYINSSGNKVYDADSYTFSVPRTKLYYQVDLDNVPRLVTAIGTRFRNHNAKYAVLANDFDYFEYSWKGACSYYADPTITLTLVYGDRIQLNRTADVSASANSTFQHGPFLLPPTTEGQLTQVTGYVIDARGRKSVDKVFTITDNNSQDNLEYLRFYAYNYPTAMVQGYRCMADGTPDDENGEYVSLTATYVFSQLDYGLTTYSEGTTDGKLIIRVKPHSGTLTQDTWTETITTATGNKQVLLKVGLNQSVDISVQVTDFIGNQFTASTEFVPSAQVVLDFRAGGTGMAIGKRNEFDKQLEVAWGTTFYGDVNFRGNVNISGATSAATTADAVTYYDTNSIGARNVQAAIDALALRTGVSTTQVQAIVDQAIRNLDVPDDEHINDLIVSKLNNIVFPPSVSEARVLDIVTDALKDYYTKLDIDLKLANLNVDLSGYYTKQEVDDKIQAIPAPDMTAYSTTIEVKKMIDDALAAIIDVNEVKF